LAVNIYCVTIYHRISKDIQLTTANDGRNREQQQREHGDPIRMWPALINLINSNASYWRTQTNKADDPLPEKIRFWTMLAAIGTILGFVAASVAAFAVWKQFGAMVDATDSSDDAFKLDQRAWLGANDYTYNITETGPVHSAIAVLNTGKTPAMKILCRITGTTKPKDYNLTVSDIAYPAELPTLKQGAAFPNQHFPVTAGAPAMEPGNQKIWFGKIVSRELVQYFYGDIRYRDVFGTAHWTHFCTRYVPGTNSGTPCDIYNDAGDYKDGDPNAPSPN
jgi:hypothetical protein